ncbi:hypothetical protein [Chryseolinea soli]|uniref:Cupin domain-containing protein n=1 Tax=Chryseolinea soli TaxID=2321403 RepID=A0A385SIT2_9BACT|nr:hypothetical protein [Chryseolinea soli]AYB31653.1 hypothetical protein D4L85_14230 [Chryseolinea soli]
MKKCLPSVAFLFFIFLIPSIRAQVPVEEDPFHKIVFENKFVRVLDLTIRGSDTTTMHVHRAASVVVFLTKSPLVIQAPGEAAVVTPVDIGNMLYRPYDETPTTHRVWSQDGSTMRCMVIEIKHDATQRDGKPIVAPDVNLLSNQKRVNVYDLKGSQGKALSLSSSPCPYFLLNISGPLTASVSGEKHFLNAGDFIFIPAQSQATLLAAKDNKSILIQLK